MICADCVNLSRVLPEPRAAEPEAIATGSPTRGTGVAHAPHLNRRIRYLDIRPPFGRCQAGRCVMFEESIAIIHSIGLTFVKILPVTIALGAAFAILSFFWSCNSGRPWWRKRGLLTDLCYWFLIPLFARYLRIGLLVIGAAVVFGITSADGLVEFYDDGHGPLAQLPLWLQASVVLVGSDL